MNLLAIRLPSEAHFSSELSVYSMWGIPMSVSAAGLAMDVDRQYSLVKALDGDTEKPKQFFLQSGMNGSALEYSVPEQLWSTTDNPAYGISAVKALKIVNDHTNKKEIQLFIAWICADGQSLSAINRDSPCEPKTDKCRQLTMIL